MENVLLFIVLLLISGSVWLIDRLGRAAAKAEQEQRRKLAEARARARAQSGGEGPEEMEPGEPFPAERPQPMALPAPPIPRGRLPVPAMPPRGAPAPRIAKPSAPPPGQAAAIPRRSPVPRAMRERVRLREVPRPIDQIRRQTSRARRVNVARARDGIVLSVILGPCRATDPFGAGPNG